jgi:hypothetical protein
VNLEYVLVRASGVFGDESWVESEISGHDSWEKAREEYERMGGGVTDLRLAIIPKKKETQKEKK